MSLPGSHSFELARGKDFTRRFRKLSAGVPVNLTGWKVRCQFRTLDGQYGLTAESSLLLALADGAGVAITDAVNGRVQLTLTPAQTAILCPDNVKTKVAYEIELYDDSTPPERVDGLVAGKVTVLPETAR